MKRLMRWVKGLAGCLLLTWACGIAVNAQTQITTGTIEGTVTDTNGAVVPGATVEIKNLDTGFSRDLTTDENGRFVGLALADPVPDHSTLSRRAETLEMVKFSHTVFALPFALLSAVLAAGGWPDPATLGKILLAMVAARSAAMAHNRLADRAIDAANPRTASRAGRSAG